MPKEENQEKKKPSPISPSGSENNNQAVNESALSLISSVRDTFRQDDQLKRTLSKNLSIRTATSMKFIQRAQEAFKSFDLSRVPLEIRKDPTFLSKGDELFESQQAIIKRDIEAMKSYNIRHSIRLTLSDKDIEKYGLTKSEGGSITGDMKLCDILANIEEKSDGVGVLGVGVSDPSQSALTTCAAEIEAERKIGQIGNHHERNPEGTISDSADRNDGNTPAESQY